MESRDAIVVLGGRGDNDAVNFLMRSCAEPFRRRGCEIAYVDLQAFGPAEQDGLASLLATGRVRFALTWLGYGQDLRYGPGPLEGRNLWEHHGIPLLKFQGDSPAHFLERHGDVPSTSVNLYGYDEYLEFLRAALPASRCLSALVDPLLLHDTPAQEVDFKAKARGTLLFLKNTVDPSVLEERWRRELPPALGRQLRELSAEVLEAGLKPGRLAIHKIVLDYLETRRIDLRGNARLLAFYVSELDHHLRHVKAALLAEALLPFPVAILGSGWDFLDTSGARAKVGPSQDPGLTATLYRTQLGVIDLPPNVDSGPHDRMVRAAGTWTFGLTARGRWLEDLCPELNAAAYTFEPEAIQEAVEKALRDPAGTVELGRRYGEAFRARWDAEGFARQVETLAAMARI